MNNQAVTIEQYEAILNGSREFDEGTDNWTIYRAYQDSKTTGNPRLDFNEVIWDADIRPIADTLRKSGIKEFTISVRQGNLTDILAAFQELGFFLYGIVNVKTRYHASNGEHEVTAAILLQSA